MNILDYIKNLFSNGKKNVKIIAEDLTKVYKNKEPLEVALYCDNTPISNEEISIEINNVVYKRITDENGIAKLNINLGVGKYRTFIKYAGNNNYNSESKYVDVYVNPQIETSDLSMKHLDGSQFTATLKDAEGTLLSNIDVKFNINGVDYVRKSENGIARLNIKLNVGTYIIQTKYNNIVKTNTIIINEKTTNNHFGFWIFGKDMKSVNFQDCKKQGVTDIFLNYYAFKVHGNQTVIDWIKEAKTYGIDIHIWMQSFYNGEWINPATADLSDKINEAKEYAAIPNVAGIHLDYLRYPGTAYKTQGGIDAITNFVKEVKKVINGKILSCAVMPENDNGYYYGQNISALGQVADAIIPMAYKGNYNAGTSWLATTAKIFSSKANIWMGLQSYRSDNDTSLLSVDELNQDINACLNNGAKGTILFRFGLTPNITFPTSLTSKKSTRMEGTDMNMTYLDGSKYQCAVYGDNGRIAGTVKITINGVTYEKTPDETGLYKLNINLLPGTYKITAEYIGDDTYSPSSIENTIVIKEQPKKEETVSCNSPYTSSPHPTGSGCNAMGQNTSTYCAPSSVHKCLYKFGIRDISQGTLASWMGTGSAGTSHAGIETGIAKVNKTKGTKISVKWYNLSDLGWDKIGKIICQPNKAVLTHILYKNGGTCSGSGNFGHYETLTKVNTGTKYVKVINSLGSKCGSCYCGFYQDRTMSCEEVFISGISQKSICVLTKQ